MNNKLPELTEDEVLTLRKVLHDWGLIDSYFIADFKKVEALKDKLNVHILVQLET